MIRASLFSLFSRHSFFLPSSLPLVARTFRLCSLIYETIHRPTFSFRSNFLQSLFALLSRTFFFIPTLQRNMVTLRSLNKNRGRGFVPSLIENVVILVIKIVKLTLLRERDTERETRRERRRGGEVVITTYLSSRNLSVSPRIRATCKFSLDVVLFCR